MTTETEDGQALAERVLALGRQGMVRGEILVAVGLMEAELAALEAAQPHLARAMELAETAAQAWFDTQVREAIQERFDPVLWRAYMRMRFPDFEAATPPSQPTGRRRWAAGVGFY